MSGFGIRAFKRLKEQSLHTDDKRKYFSHIVVGNDFLAVWLYLNLIKQHGESNVCLITENFIDKNRLLEEWKCSIKTLRSEEVARTLIGLKPELEIIPSNTTVKFYKDTKFHEFGKRTKSLPLQPGEEYFQQPYFEIKYQNLFSDEEWNELDQRLAKQENKILSVIELTTPQDLVEKTNFKLHTGEYESFDCEYLHWLGSPKQFYRLVKDKSDLNESVVDYCTNLDGQTAVVVLFECDRQISEEAGTVFLPQSLTHDWGHFIVDFNQYDIEKNSQSFTGLILLKEEDLTEEELAKKIKLLKRVIERVYPEFVKANFTEHIRFSEDMFIFGMKDELIGEVKKHLPQLHFSGIAAPLNVQDSQGIFSYSRAMISLMN